MVFEVGDQLMPIGYTKQFLAELIDIRARLMSARLNRSQNKTTVLLECST